jgi:hypothetical protein
MTLQDQEAKEDTNLAAENHRLAMAAASSIEWADFLNIEQINELITNLERIKNDKNRKSS